MVTDDYNRADGGLGANWTTVNGTPVVAGNQGGGTDGGYNAARYTGAAFAANHYAQITRANTSNWCGPAVNCLAGSGGSWVAYYSDGRIRRVVNGSTVDLLFTNAFNNGDVARIYREGEYVIAVRNGVVQATVHEPVLASVGGPGYIVQGSVPRVDDFEADDITTATQTIRVTQASLTGLAARGSDAGTIRVTGVAATGLSSRAGEAGTIRITGIVITGLASRTASAPTTPSFNALNVSP